MADVLPYHTPAPPEPQRYWWALLAAEMANRLFVVALLAASLVLFLVGAVTLAGGAGSPGSVQVVTRASAARLAVFGAVGVAAACLTWWSAAAMAKRRRIGFSTAWAGVITFLGLGHIVAMLVSPAPSGPSKAMAGVFAAGIAASALTVAVLRRPGVRRIYQAREAAVPTAGQVPRG